jgi:hypothetical protein
MSEPKSPKKQFSDITHAQAERAIYIDFEGFTDKAPSLIGVLVDDIEVDERHPLVEW